MWLAGLHMAISSGQNKVRGIMAPGCQVRIMIQGLGELASERLRSHWLTALVLFDKGIDISGGPQPVLAAHSGRLGVVPHLGPA
jgi:hypothetical protein